MKKILSAYIAVFCIVCGWSLVHPVTYLDWFLETFPALVGFLILLFTYKRFPLTTLLYTLILIHMIVLFVGGHYTYANVPLFNWIRDYFHLGRNDYDKVGHFAQGFVPVMIAREILLRTTLLQPSRMLSFLCVCVVGAISSMYEIFEWIVAVLLKQSADIFLGTQGYVWDTQTDMFMAFVGAICAIILLSKLHDRQLKSLLSS